MAITQIILKDEQDTIEVRKALQSLADEISGAGGSTTNNITNAAREVRMILSNNSGAPNTTVDIAAGQVYAQDNETLIKNTATIQATLASPANNTWYRVFILGGDGVTAQGTITTSTTPTLPTGYTLYRRIGWVRTDGSGNLLGFKQTQNDILLGVSVQDLSKNSSWSGWDSSGQSVAVTAPPSSIAKIRGSFFSDAAGRIGKIYSPLITDVAISSNGLANIRPPSTSVGYVFTLPVLTDASSTIRARLSGTSGTLELIISCEGWTDLDI